MQRSVLNKKIWSVLSIASSQWSKMNSQTKILDLARWRLLLATMTRVVSVVEKRVGGKKKKKAFQLKWYNNPYQHPYCESELQFPFSPQTFLALWYQNHMVVLEIIIPLPLCSSLHILRACCLFTNDKIVKNYNVFTHVFLLFPSLSLLTSLPSPYFLLPLFFSLSLSLF